MNLNIAIAASLLTPVFGAMLIFLLRKYRRMVEIIFVASAMVLLLITVYILNSDAHLSDQVVRFTNT